MLRHARRLCSARRTVADLLEGRDLTNKTYVVSGAEAGLGLSTAVALAGAGATVLMACADAARGRAVADALNERTGKQSAVCSVALDLGSWTSIKAWSESVHQHLGMGQTLNGVLHHAGVMGLGKYTLSADGEEMQWAMNYSGPFRLTQCLWVPLLQHNSKVVCLTSASHCTPNKPLDFSNLPWQGSSEDTYNGWTAYQQSKLAAILFSNEINRQFSTLGSEATSVAVCESDKWFIMPRVLLDDDKKEIAPGPLTSIAALLLDSVAYGGKYLVDAQVATPGEHAQSESDAFQLWEYSMRHRLK